MTTIECPKCGSTSFEVYADAEVTFPYTHNDLADIPEGSSEEDESGEVMVVCLTKVTQIVCDRRSCGFNVPKGDLFAAIAERVDQ